MTKPDTWTPPMSKTAMATKIGESRPGIAGVSHRFSLLTLKDFSKTRDIATVEHMASEREEKDAVVTDTSFPEPEFHLFCSSRRKGKLCVPPTAYLHRCSYPGTLSELWITSATDTDVLTCPPLMANVSADLVSRTANVCSCVCIDCLGVVHDGPDLLLCLAKYATVVEGCLDRLS